MQFLLVAYDAKDPDALSRRMDARPEHLENIAGLKRNREFLFGGAILDDDGKMVGSVVLYDFPDRKSLDEMLKKEPYIAGKVWDEIKIMPFKLANIE